MLACRHNPYRRRLLPALAERGTDHRGGIVHRFGQSVPGRRLLHASYFGEKDDLRHSGHNGIFLCGPDVSYGLVDGPDQFDPYSACLLRHSIWCLSPSRPCSRPFLECGQFGSIGQARGVGRIWPWASHRWSSWLAWLSTASTSSGSSKISATYEDAANVKTPKTVARPRQP